MHDKRNDRVVITRGTQGETVGGKPRPPRVYVTGPHFGRDVFSSTENRAGATVYRREDAEHLIASRKWQHHIPEIEDAGA